MHPIPHREQSLQIGPSHRPVADKTVVVEKGADLATADSVPPAPAVEAAEAAEGPAGVAVDGTAAPEGAAAADPAA